jgi:LysR family hydrogen peroxide-inducible transcriptional activator
VRLTAIGDEIYQSAVRIHQEVARMKEVAHSAKDPLSGALHIGVFPTLAAYILPKIIPLFREQLPKLQLYLIEDKTPQLYEQLYKGTLDCALLALPISDTKLHATPLFTEAFYLAVPKNHPLSSHSSVTIEDMHKESLLLLEDGHCMREQALQICGFTPNEGMDNYRATSLETLRNMVAAGRGVTLIPAIAIKENDPDICYIPFASPIPTRTIGLVWRATSPRKNLFEAIVRLISSTA